MKTIELDVLLAGVVIWLALGTSANAVTCPAALPNFSTFVNANGSQQQDCEGVPIQNSVLGANLVGDADVTGISRLGNLGAVAHARFTSPVVTGDLSSAFADVSWHDTFRFLHAGLGRGTLAFTVALTGAISTSGNPLEGALGGDVLARLFVTDGFTGATVSGSLSGPGVITIQAFGVPLGIPDDIEILSELRLEAFASGPGNATADFLDTFDITKIQLFDAAGALLDDNVTLTDAAGGVLPNLQAPAVPEPPSVLLLGVALAALLFCPLVNIPRRQRRESVRDRIDQIHRHARSDPGVTLPSRFEISRPTPGFVNSICAAALCLGAQGLLPASAAESMPDKSATRPSPPPLTINLTASSTAPATGQSVTLTATTSFRIGRGAAIEIYVSGGPILKGCELTNVCSLALRQDTSTVFPGNVAFVAYVTVYTDVDSYVEAQSNEVSVRWPPLVREFPTGITPASFLDGPSGITAGPDGNLWFVEGRTVAKLTAAGTVSPFPVLSSSFARLHQITAGADGNLWFTEFGCNKVGNVTPAGKISEFPIRPDIPDLCTGQIGSEGIAAGPDGNLWFTEFMANKVAQMNPVTGKIRDEYSPDPSQCGQFGSDCRPYGIAARPDGLWATETNDVVKVTTDGLVSKFTLPSNAGPWGIAVGPDGNLWIIEQIANKVAKVTPDGVVSSEFDIPTANAQAWAITAGPDGNLWFTERNANKVAKINPSGSVAEFDIPTRNSGPQGITVGPDGYIWFTEFYANQVARLGPLAVP